MSYSYPPMPATQRSEYVPVFFPHNPSPIYIHAALPPVPYVEPVGRVEHHLVQQLLRSVGNR